MFFSMEWKERGPFSPFGVPPDKPEEGPSGIAFLCAGVYCGSGVFVLL
jgi:hypothetical protein